MPRLNSSLVLASTLFKVKPCCLSQSPFVLDLFCLNEAPSPYVRHKTAGEFSKKENTTHSTQNRVRVRVRVRVGVRVRVSVILTKKAFFLARLKIDF